MGVERRGKRLFREQGKTLVLDTEYLDHHEHAQRQTQRRIEVGGRHRTQVGVRGVMTGEFVTARPQPRQQVDRQQVDEVHHEHQHEDRDRQRGNELALAVERLAHQAVDRAHHHLDEALELAGGTDRRLARGADKEKHEQGRQQQREEHRVEVDRPERAVAKLPLQELQMVLDVLGRAASGCCFNAHA